MDHDERRRRERDIFDRALAAPPSQREEIVKKACEGDLELEADLVRLLAAHDRAERGPESLVESPRLADPEAIGPYRIVERIGEGGMGVVYLADQTEPIQRRVALKVIRAGMSSDEVIRRFHSERRALALMDHPGIARIFDSGATEQGLPYFVMEHVPGEPLLAYCDRKTLPLEARLALFVDVCRAVQHAHGKGIIHRDIKPSNVLVVEVDDKPVAKVIDFGIAKATDPTQVDDAVVTQAGRIIGTPAYMAPEQIAGATDDVDTRADVYALGVMLYEVLTGVMPFDLKSLSGSSFAEIQRILVEVDPPIPSRRLAGIEDHTEAARQRGITHSRLISRIRGDLDQVVAKALEKDRRRRYETVNDLARDIERYLAREPVMARAPSRLYLTRKLIARHRFLVGAGALLAIALLLGSVGTGIGFVRASRAKVLAENREQEAVAAAGRANAVRDFVTGMLASANPLQSLRKDVRVSDLLSDAVDSLDQGKFSDDPDSEYAVRLALGQAFRGIDRLPDAERQLRIALELLPRTKLTDPLDLLQPELELAAVIHKAGRWSEAETLSQRALDELDGREVGDHPLRIEALELLGGVRQNESDMAAACDYAKAALEASDRVHGEASEEAARKRAMYGFYLRLDGKLDESLAQIDRALEIMRGGSRRARYDMAFALRQRGAVLLQQELPEEAREDLLEALSIRETLFDEESVALANILHDLGQVGIMTREIRAAEDYTRRALDVRRKLLGDHRDTANSLVALGRLASLRRDVETATRMQEEALAMRRLVFEPDSLALADSLHRVGDLRFAVGEVDEAERLLRESIDIWARGVVPPHFEMALAQLSLGKVLRAREENGEAAAMFESALPQFVELAGPAHSRVNETRDMLIALRFDIEDYAGAETLLHETLAVQRAAKPEGNLFQVYLEAQLGAAALGQGRLEEAEEKLLKGWRILGGNPNLWAVNKLFILDFLIELYDQLDNEGEAQRYRERAAELRAGD